MSAFELLPKEENFLGVDGDWEQAKAIVFPIPMESTTSYIQGTGSGPAALLKASRQVELYDDELQSETWRKGIVTLPSLEMGEGDPEADVRKIEESARPIFAAGKKVLGLGGEHTITVGLIRACLYKNQPFSVLHLDAHADLRDRYEDSPYSHACVVARVIESCPVVSVGIRSLCVEEAELIREKKIPVFFMHGLHEDSGWMARVLSNLTERVYITLDLDVFDPSVMPSVGTPEPGGMGWRDCLNLLMRVFMAKTVVGVDIVELCPAHEKDYGPFTAAKLAYRILGYWLR